MITEIRVNNLRLFAAPRAFAFPLSAATVVCGTNSAGKSTILKLPLLLRQTFGIGEGVDAFEGRLRLAGSQVDFGTFETAVTDQDTRRSLELGLSTVGSLPADLFETLRLLAARGDSAFHVPPRSKAPSHAYEMDASFHFGIPTISNPSSFPASEGLAWVNRAILLSSTFEMRVGEQSLLRWGVHLKSMSRAGASQSPTYQLLVPAPFLRLFATHGPFDVRPKKGREEKPQRGQEEVPLGVTLQGILPYGIMDRVRPTPSDRSAASSGTFGVWPLPAPVQYAMQDLRRAVANIHYLGPLRSAARRYYVAPNSSKLEMDSTGDFLPYVLRDHAYSLVSYFPPAGFVAISDQLQVALGKWLAYLRTGSELSAPFSASEMSVSTTKDVLVELGLRAPTGVNVHALADSGFGYSQVLPILVKGLLAQPGSLLAIEQPELHLNPALQVRLAEFLVSLVRRRVQVLVETHSEHIVNAIRVVTAESAQPLDCSVYFLDTDDGRLNVHRLPIQADGMVEAWPRAFFGEAASLRGRLLRAQKKNAVHVVPPGD